MKNEYFIDYLSMAYLLIYCVWGGLLLGSLKPLLNVAYSFSFSQRNVILISILISIETVFSLILGFC